MKADRDAFLRRARALPTVPPSRFGTREAAILGHSVYVQTAGTARGEAPIKPDELRARARENRAIVGWLTGFWVVALVGFAAWLKITYEIQSDLNCPVPGSDSNYGESSWQWVPPGEVCSYPGTNLATNYPSWFGAIVGAALIVFPIVVFPLWVWSEIRIRKLLGNAA